MAPVAASVKKMVEDELQRHSDSVKKMLDDESKRVEEELARLKKDLDAATAARDELQKKYTTHVPYDGYCPVSDLNKPVTFVNTKSGKYMDWDRKRGDLHVGSQLDGGSSDIINQRFYIERVKSHFYIKWVSKDGDTVKYLKQHKTSGRNVEMSFDYVASAVVFERCSDGSCFVRLADRHEFTMGPDMNHGADGAEILMVPNGQQGADQWIVKTA